MRNNLQEIKKRPDQGALKYSLEFTIRFSLPISHLLWKHL